MCTFKKYQNKSLNVERVIKIRMQFDIYENSFKSKYNLRCKITIRSYSFMSSFFCELFCLRYLQSFHVFSFLHNSFIIYSGNIFNMISTQSKIEEKLTVNKNFLNFLLNFFVLVLCQQVQF